MPAVDFDTRAIGLGHITKALTITAKDDLTILALTTVEVTNKALPVFVGEVGRMARIGAIVLTPGETGFSRTYSIEDPRRLRLGRPHLPPYWNDRYFNA